MARKRFEFRLARVLGVRRLEERMARNAWSEAELAARQAEAGCAELRRGLEEARAALRLELGGKLAPEKVSLVHRLLDRKASELARAQASVETLREQASRLAEAWRERDARKQALERLEERQRARHRREMEVEEEREMDERAARRGE